MNRFLPLILLFLASIVAIVLFLPESGGEDQGPTTGPAANSSPEAGEHDGSTEAGGSTPEAGEYESVSRDDLEQADLASSQATTVSIQFVDASGTPVRDLEAHVTETPNFDFDLDFAFDLDSFTEGEEQLEGVRPDSEGRVVLPVTPGKSMTLMARGDYWTDTRIRLQALREGEKLDLGTQTLRSASRLQGQVLGADLKPLAGAQVRLRDNGAPGFQPDRRTASTDDDGRYSLGGLAPGSYGLTVSGPRHAVEELPGLEVHASDRDLQEDFQLERGRRATGLVMDQDRNPISGAELWVQNDSRVLWAATSTGGRPKGASGATTDRDGRFSLDGLPVDGGSRILVWAEGFAIGSIRFENEEEQLLVELSRHSRYAGRLLSPAGAPVADTRIQLKPAEGNDWRFWLRGESTTTDADGSFAFDSVEPGLYSVSASTPDASLGATQVDLAVDTVGVDLRMKSVPVLVVTAVDELGAPVPGARVSVQRKRNGLSGFGRSLSIGVSSSETEITAGPGEMGSNSRKTDELGRAWFPELAEGNYSLRVRAEGKATVEQDLVRRRGPQQEEVVLQPGADLRVQVEDGQGEPLAGVEVALHNVATGKERTMKSDRTGRAWWDGLAAGSYVVEARASISAMAGASFILTEISGAEKTQPAPVGENVELAEGDQADLVLTVKDLAIPEVLVMRGSQPVSGAEVSLQAKQGDSMGDLAGMHFFGGSGGGKPTGPDGKVQLAPVKPGSYELVVRASPHAPESREDVELVAGKQLLKSLVAGGVVEGKVVGSQGPLAGARVNLERPKAEGERTVSTQTMVFAVGGPDGEVMQMGGSSGGELVSVRTDAEGRFRFDDVPAGQWEISVRARDYSFYRSKSFTTSGSGSTDIGVSRLEQGGTIEGRVASASSGNSDEPFNFGEMVQIKEVDGDYNEMSMVRNGRYSFKDLSPGKYRIHKGEYESPVLTVRGGDTVKHDID